jgi:N-carbamoylputrescine amidase
MTRIVTVAATQFACSWDLAANLASAERVVRDAADKGANIILVQELFETPYFCAEQSPKYQALAKPVAGHAAVAHMAALARELGVVLPVSIFERAGNALFNSIVILDADGRELGVYRKSHIPDGPGYSEKYYFSPGDTGFKAWDTAFGCIGVGICWDQWFPECARAMAIAGAEILFYPTAIGSEPANASLDSKDHWQTVMRGHAGANLMPVVASNRIGTETIGTPPITFYGSSFIANHHGAFVEAADRETESVLTAAFDLDQVHAERLAWGIWRDRRPELYAPIASHGKK